MCSEVARVGFLPRQKVFLPLQQKKTGKTGKHWQYSSIVCLFLFCMKYSIPMLNGYGF